jgi:two-component system OmpR family sensor kinase
MHDRILMRWNSISLRNKMTAVSVLLLTFGLLAAGLGSMYVLKSYMTDEVVDKKVVSTMSIITSLVATSDTVDGVSCQVVPIPQYYMAVTDSSGTVLCSNVGEGDPRPDETQLLRTFLNANDELSTVSSDPGRGQWRVLTVPGTLPTSGQFVFYTVALSLDETDALITRYSAIFLFFGLTVVILGAALTRLLVTSTFTPLREVEATAARFAAGDFTQRMSGATPNTEVGRLNRSLNSMLARIDRAFADRAKTIDQMRRFVGDASHELRTPLVSVRGYAELYRMGALPNDEAVAQAMERIEKEAIRMGELVADLLELARIDEAKPLQLSAVDLIPIARDASLDTMAASPDRPVTVVVSVHSTAAEEPVAEPVDPPPAPETPAATTPTRGTRTPRGAASTRPPATRPLAIAGATLARLRWLRSRAVKPLEASPSAPAREPRAHVYVLAEENKLRQVLTNLIGNAVRFTPADSPIEIGVEVDEAASLAILSVIDHGEGIPEQIRDKIFQRFWRADSSRNRDTGGSGLGLAIVASIVAAHKGEVQVVETPGGGATFRVLLPLLQPGQEIAQLTVPAS